MSADNYAKCLAITLDFEGGYSNDPGDPGGPTKFGITIHDVRAYLNPNATADDVRHLTLDQAKEIYAKHYWSPIHGDDWPAGLDLCVFDLAVNSGTGRALRFAQQTLGGPKGHGTFESLAQSASALSSSAQKTAIQHFNDLRLAFLQHLGTWSLFGRGWGRRVRAIRSLSLKMVKPEQKGPDMPNILGNNPNTTLAGYGSLIAGVVTVAAQIINHQAVDPNTLGVLVLSIFGAITGFLAKDAGK